MLRKRGVVGKFVEYYGPGVKTLTLADRATISNMSPEYGATMGYFPVDDQTLKYLKLTGRDGQQVATIEKYLREQNLFVKYDGTQEDPIFSGEVIELDLASVQPSLAGPKRPHDKVNLSDMKSDFTTSLTNKVGFKGYGLPTEHTSAKAKI
jgi:aconitate hydratase